MLNVRYDDTAVSVDRDSIAHWLLSDIFYALIEGFG